jgi:hypothetical protein
MYFLLYFGWLDVVNKWPSTKRRNHRWSWNTWKLWCWFRGSFLRLPRFILPRLKSGLCNVAEFAQKHQKGLTKISEVDCPRFVRVCPRLSTFLEAWWLSPLKKRVRVDVCVKWKVASLAYNCPRSCPRWCCLSKTWNSICPRLPDKIT